MYCDPGDDEEAVPSIRNAHNTLIHGIKPWPNDDHHKDYKQKRQAY